MKEVNAKFQLLDNYIKKYVLNVEKRIPENSDIDINGQIGFSVINISEEDNEFIGEIELDNTIDLIENDVIQGRIEIQMGALFSAEKEIGKEKFEEMLKINGATTLSHLTRAYITANTALSSMPTIMMPLINFMEFFEQKDSKRLEN